jgi:parallel beta-helix repeat protein
VTRYRVTVLAMLTLLAGAAAAALLAGRAAPARVAGCSGVAVKPSSDIQGLIDSSPAGTMFCFAAGTYRNASQLEPRSGDVFDGDRQHAVLDGGNSAQWAFYGDARSTGPSGVTIRDFTIQHYATPLQRGAIQDYNGANWIIQDNNITSNAAAAVATGDFVQVLGNKLDGNQQEGFSAHGTGGLYQRNDISNNDTALNSDPSNGLWAGWEAGGGKAAFTTNLTFKDNTVDNNGGNGLWADTNNEGTVYTGNTVDNNWGAGIYEEQSYDFTITGNTVTRNGMPSSPGGESQAGYAFAAGIQIRRSGARPGMTSVISGNTVANNYNGITLIESPSTAGCAVQSGCRYFPWRVQNVTVENNAVTMTQGATGAWQDGEGDAIFTSRNNHFQGNNYCVSPSAHPNDG